jgi:hypothetical protein
MKNVLDRLGLSLGELSALAMESTMQKAAFKLGLGITGFKAECRRLNIKNWPYRSIKATRNMLFASNISLANMERIKAHLRMFETDPLGTDMSPPWLMDLRRQIYKRRHKLGQNARNTHETGKTSLASQASQASQASRTSQASHASRTSQVSQASRASQASQASQVSQASQASRASQASQASRTSHASRESMPWYMRIDASESEFDIPFFIVDKLYYKKHVSDINVLAIHV